MLYLHGNSMFSWPTAGQGHVSIGHRGLLHNDYFVNCFRLKSRKFSSWSRTKLQVMFPVVGTHSHHPLSCITSKIFHPFKHIYKLENICSYSPPCHTRQRNGVNRKFWVCLWSLTRAISPFCGEKRTRHLLAPKQMVQVLLCSWGLRSELQREWNIWVHDGECGSSPDVFSCLCSSSQGSQQHYLTFLSIPTHMNSVKPNTT